VDCSSLLAVSKRLIAAHIALICFSSVFEPSLPGRCPTI